MKSSSECTFARRRALKEQKKWIEAAQIAYERDNYYGFCSGIRGLIEACADTFYTVRQIIGPVSDNFAHVEQALQGNATRVLLAGRIEEALIHYVFARKLTGAEKTSAASAHNAEHVKTYVECLADQNVLNLYCELCQVSHPSAISLEPFLLSTEESDLVLHDEQTDRFFADQLLERHKEPIVKATGAAVIPAMCVLKLINEFDAPITEALRTDNRSLAPATSTELWQDTKRKIAASRTRPNASGGTQRE